MEMLIDIHSMIRYHRIHHCQRFAGSRKGPTVLFARVGEKYPDAKRTVVLTEGAGVRIPYCAWGAISLVAEHSAVIAMSRAFGGILSDIPGCRTGGSGLAVRRPEADISLLGGGNLLEQLSALLTRPGPSRDDAKAPEES